MATLNYNTCQHHSNLQELRVHKAILAASSEYFQKLFCSTSKIEIIQFHQRMEVVEQLILCMYGGSINTTLKPEIVLEILSEARNLGMDATLSRDYSSIITPQLEPLTSLKFLASDEVYYHPKMLKCLHRHITSNFSRILKDTRGIETMQTISRQRLLPILAEVCIKCSELEVESILQFVLDWSHLVSLCDLLKECKAWEWDKSSQVQTVTLDKATNESDKRVAVKCIGHSFEWHVYINKDSAEDFHLIYDKALPRIQCPTESLQRRFPTASFQWKDTVNPPCDRVFICFPHSIALRWSSTISLPKDSKLDHALIPHEMTVVENPLASLILYYFSRSLTNAKMTEDLLNGLPHVEYRCLSSYLLFNDVSKSILAKSNE
ncbi:BTB/POZ domain-containing protein [Cardiosporidium cionae]|uniref:BTB/POZ domain-containing protein n=1 Tax=Cardiosporidium cionae TaxID=476202 RepID=A0ABQ7J700_9APIC|nr:BTB/POZ domain-containing protein [Cardiosporidium cionae]|eukprot:KAF8819765.1 BTB/POZ domain-containing protein [Cardiosporidium cionae]